MKTIRTHSYQFFFTALFALIVLAVILNLCSAPTPLPPSPPTRAPTLSPTARATLFPSPTLTSTFAVTATNTRALPTFSPTSTFTETFTPTPPQTDTPFPTLSPSVTPTVTPTPRVKVIPDTGADADGVLLIDFSILFLLGLGMIWLGVRMMRYQEDDKDAA